MKYSVIQNLWKERKKYRTNKLTFTSSLVRGPERSFKELQMEVIPHSVRSNDNKVAFLDLELTRDSVPRDIADVG